MLLTIEKGIRRRICCPIHQYTKANDKNMKDDDENKELSYLKYWDVNNLYGWAVSPKFPVSSFEWIKNTSQFDEDFIKIYNEESDEEYFSRLMFNILKNYMNFLMIYHFYQKKWKFKKSKSLLLIYMIKINVIHICNLKKALNHGLKILRTAHRVFLIKKHGRIHILRWMLS